MWKVQTCSIVIHLICIWQHVIFPTCHCRVCAGRMQFVACPRVRPELEGFHAVTTDSTIVSIEFVPCSDALV